MAEKKVAKKTVKKTPAKKTKSKAKTTTAKGTKSKTKSKKYDEPSGDGGIVIVDDDIVIDKEKINEERRAYLEEARSQEASD